MASSHEIQRRARAVIPKRRGFSAVVAQVRRPTATGYPRRMPGEPPTRIVTLVLVTVDGTVLGQLPAFPVEPPWWQEVGPVVRAARDRFGLDITVLRLLDTELPSAHGGAVTYLAEAEGRSVEDARTALPLTPWAGRLDDDPHRRAYASPGGPDADLAWADGVLAGAGQARTRPAEQVRTWNLSSLWRLPTDAGGAWLKVVPPFFAHEGALLERLAGEAVPALLGRDGERMLLAAIPGDDRYDAPLPELLEMVDILVGLQRRWAGREAELLELGLPDWRAPALTDAIDRVVGLAGPGLDRGVRTLLATFVAGLPERFASIASCGLPDGLVHGDFHPGNVRGVAGRLVLLDWGDSCVGHPLLDQPAFLTRIDEAAVRRVRETWDAAWSTAVPGSDPGHAARLLVPVAAARQAVIYQRFLDKIEPAEHAYHAADVPDWLCRTADILSSEHTAHGAAD
jgi:hypothetical protein